MAKSQHYKKVYQKQGPTRTWTARLLQVAFFGILLMPVAAFATFAYYAKDLPRPEKFSEVTLAQPTKIYDRTGEVLLYEVLSHSQKSLSTFNKP